MVNSMDLQLPKTRARWIELHQQHGNPDIPVSDWRHIHQEIREIEKRIEPCELRQWVKEAGGEQ